MREGENSSRTGPQHEDKQAQSAFPEQRVDAVEGASAVLICLVDNQTGVETSTVEWSKVGEKTLVHVYKHRKDQVHDQAEEFRGRTTLYREGLKRGNVTLELDSVHLSDSGQYICFIRQLNYNCSITLNIVSNAQNNMTKGENSSTTGPPDEDNQAFPEQRVDAVEGVSAILICLVDNRPGVETSTVEWSKNGEKRLVHVYKHRKDQDHDQAEEFRGRTTLYREGLKRGNVTLELDSVHLSDSGQYVCFIRQLNYRCSITLNIVSNAQNNMTKGENSSTTGPPDEDNQGRLNTNVAIVLAIVFSIASLTFIIIIIRRRKAMNEENGRREPAHAPERQPLGDVSIASELHPRDQH